ncbi:hypothetical protein YC2023_083864 [Brassica napus]
MFGVYVGKDNVDYGSHICNIGKTWSADEIISESDDDNSEDTLTNGVSSDRSSGQVSFITIDSEDNTCLSSTPLSKRKVDNEIEDLSSTSKKQCSKIIKVEKTKSFLRPGLDICRMKRKHLPPLGVYGHKKRSQSDSKQRHFSSQSKDVPLRTVFARLLNDITSQNIESISQPRVTASPLPTLDHVQVSSHLENKTLQILKCQTQKNRDTPKDSGMLGKEGSKVDPVNEDLLGNMDEYDDLQFDCSSQESGETDNTDDGQPIALEPEKDNQSDRVSFLAAMFKKTFSEVKTKVKPVKAKEDEPLGVVAHRLSTIKNTYVIDVVKNGALWRKEIKRLCLIKRWPPCFFGTSSSECFYSNNKMIKTSRITEIIVKLILINIIRDICKGLKTTKTVRPSNSQSSQSSNQEVKPGLFPGPIH